MSSVAEVAAALADRVPGVVKFGEQDLADVSGWIAEARLPVFISKESQCWKRGPVVLFDRALLPGAGNRWVSRVSAFAARRLPPRAANTIARTARRLDFALMFTRERDASGFPVEMRTFPFVWLVRADPGFRQWRGGRVIKSQQEINDRGME